MRTYRIYERDGSDFSILVAERPTLPTANRLARQFHSEGREIGVFLEHDGLALPPLCMAAGLRGHAYQEF